MYEYSSGQISRLEFVKNYPINSIQLQICKNVFFFTINMYIYFDYLVFTEFLIIIINVYNIMTIKL